MAAPNQSIAVERTSWERVVVVAVVMMLFVVYVTMCITRVRISMNSSLPGGTAELKVAGFVEEVRY